MSERLTPEREAEIRAILVTYAPSLRVGYAVTDLLTELDAVRGENKELRAALEIVAKSHIKRLREVARAALEKKP